ncbi:hypothetical protein [Herbiconiux sp. VKM Ac-2851]|uniref:hypothetical protein n=1 Tax=Herbiconiux sp. VKM Ac-2851 TaxID=2739025 RepID=UPI00156387B5|nr:hypothetical protein [Herbiconiux sp. VKM Ac-2851]NQX36264.1 hypothetical protein [Herbiconiux sp. VKM Ac-2851]
MTDTTAPEPIEKPTSYTDEVAPMPHWGDKGITMDALIKAHLVEGQRLFGWQHERMTAAFDYPPGDKSWPARLAMARMLNSTLGFLMSCVEASLLMDVQKHLAPEQADEFAEAHVGQGESGDYYPEMLWDWLVERGIDPELINAQVADEIAERPESDLDAERVAAFERVKALGWVDLNHIDEIVDAVLGIAR